MSSSLSSYVEAKILKYKDVVDEVLKDKAKGVLLRCTAYQKVKRVFKNGSTAGSIDAFHLKFYCEELERYYILKCF